MRDATHYVETDVDVPADQLAAYAAARFARVELDPTARTGADVVEVVANHGRWVVECPDCGGALLAHPGDPRFLCAECGNAGTGGQYRRVLWPKSHAAIAELLDQRPPELANWNPGESVADLRAENELLARGPVLLEAPPWHDPKWFDPDKPHAHRYPKTLEGDVVECLDCGHPFPTAAVADDRKAGA